jgi:hypothetical protein
MSRVAMACASTLSLVSRPLASHDVKGTFLGRPGAAGEGFLAEGHPLAASEQPVRIDVGRNGARLARDLEQRNTGVDVAQVRASLSDALLIVSDRAYDLYALASERGDGANLGHAP